MRRRDAAVGAIMGGVLAAGAALALFAHGGGSPATVPTPDASAPTHCTIRGVLPDPVCTPGVTNPNVTQANINTTICVKGWTATVRPPVSFTNSLKVKQIAAYGYLDTKLGSYEEDHLISLELGGHPTAPANLWPEPGASPNAKDKVENALHALVCSGQMTLAEAQRRIATDWTTAVPHPVPAAPTPVVAPTVAATVSPGKLGTMQPPRTGDGGLR